MHQVHLTGVHDLGDNGHAMLIADRAKDFQPLFSKSLKAVRTGARLKSAATQNIGPGFLNQARDRVQNLGAFNGAWARDHGEGPTANARRAHLYYRVLLPELPAGKLGRLQDGPPLP